MRVYIFAVLGAMGLSAMCTGGCLGGDNTDVLSGNGGGSAITCPPPDTCETPTQVRMLAPVLQFGTEIEVRYDSLDRREPRVGDQKLPTTELQPGDLIIVDPISDVYRETVLVTKTGVVQDNNTSKWYRTFRGTFTKGHALNAPATTPIADGCPEFKMPVQEVCDEDGKVLDLAGSCYKHVCMYGELVLVVKEDGAPCGSTLNAIDWTGTCRIIGGTFGMCDTKQ